MSKKLSKEKQLPEVKKIFEPLKEQILLMFEYIQILETRRDLDDQTKVLQLSEFMRMINRHCEIYLNCQLLNTGKTHG